MASGLLGDPAPVFPGLRAASWAAVPRTSRTLLLGMSSGPRVYGSLQFLHYLHSVSLSRDVNHAASAQYLLPNINKPPPSVSGTWF